MLLAIIFRKLPDYGVKNFHAITINYFVCFIIGSLLEGAPALPEELEHTQWLPYAVFLSFCFIIFFNVNAMTIQKVGMVITSIFQKLSLIAPVMLGLIFFSEVATQYKLIGILLTILAIILVSYQGKVKNKGLREYWYLPILVFFGSGLIECMLFFIEEKGYVSNAGLRFASTLFLLAGVWGLVMILIKLRLPFSRQDLIAGVLIGIPNFFTIYLIIKGLELGWDGSVLFPMNNVGVIVLTSIIGLFLFREKLNSMNKLGLVLSIFAVYLLSQ